MSFEATYPDGRPVSFGDKALTLDGRRWIVVGVSFREERGPIAEVKAVDEFHESTFSVEMLAYDPDPISIIMAAPDAHVLLDWLLGATTQHGTLDIEVSRDVHRALLALRGALEDGDG